MGEFEGCTHYKVGKYQIYLLPTLAQIIKYTCVVNFLMYSYSGVNIFL